MSDERSKNTKTHNNDAVSERLWRLVEEYDTLKGTLDDPKVLLTALKQQTDLLVVISRSATDADRAGDEEAIEPGSALNELREIFRKLQPVLF